MRQFEHGEDICEQQKTPRLTSRMRYYSLFFANVSLPATILAQVANPDAPRRFMSEYQQKALDKSDLLDRARLKLSD